MTFSMNFPISRTNNKEQPTDQVQSESINISSPLIIVGANGSGKTRLGSWIETNNPKVHRIFAQRSLSMPEYVSTTGTENALNILHTGYASIDIQRNPHLKDNIQFKIQQKYNNKPNTHLLNDFQPLLDYLLSEHSDISVEFRENYNKNKTITNSRTKLDNIKELWEKVIPHRELIFKGQSIKVCVRNDNSSEYNASEMSYGERVIFYLIGQSLAVSKNSIIIIDEPEIHLHKSIQNRLWSEIEAQRNDCLFIYLTHDLDFAVSKQAGMKIWLKDYDGKTWEWENLKNSLDISSSDIPEELFLKIKGSRQPIIFVEGKLSSLDIQVYKICYPDFLIIPRGSCENVIRSTKVFKNNVGLHTFKVCGIIDGDRRTKEEIEILANDNIYVIDVVEVENLFLVEEMMKIVCEHLCIDNYDSTLNKTKNFIVGEFKKELDEQVLMHVENELQLEVHNKVKSLENTLQQQIKNQIKKLEADLKNSKNKQKVNNSEENNNDSEENNNDSEENNNDSEEKSITSLIKEPQVKNTYERIKSKFEKLITTNNYIDILKVYNRKSLCTRIGRNFGLDGETYPNHVIRIGQNSKEYGEKIRNTLQEILPKIDPEDSERGSEFLIENLSNI